MNNTVEFWKGEFGNQYTARNRFMWKSRVPFWNKIIEKTGARSVYEVGCNVGYNLSAIRYENDHVQVAGEDVNESAIWIALTAGLDVILIPRNFVAASTELVFTSGVLIHIAPQDLKAFMRRIVDASCDYVLAVEYEAAEETEVEYRGHAGKLWKRNYGKLYEEMGLTLVEYGLLGEGSGFDANGISYWLLRK
jgi:pseudaminic acid biosynthesis-associated methylase